MALDSKQKRGSVMSWGLPWRLWLAEPDGTLAATDRLSVMRYGAAIAFGAAPTFDTVPSQLRSSLSLGM